jgi:serine/threonine protein kinase/tetratricopeptide (TPR) repeat protein
MQRDLARLEAIFAEAVAKADAAARAAYLDEACDGSSALLGRVEALLASHESAGSRLKLPGANEVMIPFVTLSERAGSKIGRFKLLEQIGEGGFAVVFMAEQEFPVRRRVALKIIKFGMDTRQIVARFEAERQALAMMDHPNVAKVFDGGATAPASGYPGRPYFVMELVRGIPITQYCDHNSLNIRERLALFMQVCRAVEHAHQKGLIHRDIKPSNVLVSTEDGQPHVKVIDFGIAKAMQAPLTDKTLFTEFQQLIGTPAYMSPEQAEGSLDIDTRSDVYSLGVLLYELLAGAPPLDPKQLRNTSFAEMQRIIREVEPPTPSTRLSTLAADAQERKAGQRKSDPGRLRHILMGDLDWIVMKCLEKNRGCRYSTANALAADLERYLCNEPVEARRPTGIYRLKKFVARNRAAVLGGSAVTLTLAIGLAAATIGFIQARRQAEIARTQAARSEKVAQFLKDMLEAGGHPKEGQLADLDRLFDDALLLDTEGRLVRAVLLRSRGALRAQIGKWDDAVADCIKANQLALDGGIWSFDSAIVLLKAGREDEYRRVCHAYLERVGNKPDFMNAEMAAKVSLLLPMEGADFDHACEMADFAANATEPQWHVPCVQLCKALAEFRLGNLDSAENWAQRAITNDRVTPRQKAAAYYIQSSAFARLGNSDAARSAFDKGNELLKQPRDAFSTVFGDTWCDWTIAEYLRSEAAELIEQDAVAAQP